MQTAETRDQGTKGQKERPAERPAVRDVRVDQIGLVKLLVSQHAEPLIDSVKASLALKGAGVAEGDVYRGLLVSGGTVQTVSPELWLRAWKRKEITEAQFVAAISVNKTAALEAMGKSRLAEISTHAPATPQLRVSQIQKIPITVLDAVRSIAAALGD